MKKFHRTSKGTRPLRKFPKRILENLLQSFPLDKRKCLVRKYITKYCLLMWKLSMRFSRQSSSPFQGTADSFLILLCFGSMPEALAFESLLGLVCVLSQKYKYLSADAGSASIEEELLSFGSKKGIYFTFLLSVRNQIGHIKFFTGSSDK